MLGGESRLPRLYLCRRWSAKIRSGGVPLCEIYLLPAKVTWSNILMLLATIADTSTIQQIHPSFHGTALNSAGLINSEKTSSVTTVPSVRESLLLFRLKSATSRISGEEGRQRKTRTGGHGGHGL